MLFRGPTRARVRPVHHDGWQQVHVPVVPAEHSGHEGCQRRREEHGVRGETRGVLCQGGGGCPAQT